jgi:hypothetical protein
MEKTKNTLAGEQRLERLNTISPSPITNWNLLGSE